MGQDPERLGFAMLAHHALQVGLPFRVVPEEENRCLRERLLQMDIADGEMLGHRFAIGVVGERRRSAARDRRSAACAPDKIAGLYYACQIRNIEGTMIKPLVVSAMAFILFAACCSQAAAHEIWIEKRPGAFELCAGHRSGAHEGSKAIDYPLKWVKSATCFDGSGQRIQLRFPKITPAHATSTASAAACVARLLIAAPASEDAAQAGVAIARGPEATSEIKGSEQVSSRDASGSSAHCAAVVFETSSGYWTKTPYGTKNLAKSESSMPVKSWQSFESVKYLSSWTPKLAAPLGRTLEISPLSDPFSLDEGDKIRVRVSFEGRPAPSALVAYDGKERGSTGRDGELNIRLRHRGFQFIQAELRLPGDGEKTDEIIHGATLNFELAGRGTEER